MEYNTQRKKLIIPEYGRYIQQLVDLCVKTQDLTKRNQLARSTIKVMGDLNPHLRDVPDFQHKLWDQLQIMAEFQLHIDSPYPIPTKEQLNKPPKKMEYPKNDRNFRFYGSNIKKMIDVAKKWDSGEKKDSLGISIANQMKKNYLKWNKDQVCDQIIFGHLKELSDGKICVPDGSVLSEIIPQPIVNNSSSNKNKSQKRGNQYNYKRK